MVDGLSVHEGRTRLDAEGSNALARAMGLLSDEWTLMLLRHAHRGFTRYSEFQAELPISNSVLSARLDLLVNESMLEKRIHHSGRLRSEYVLTPKGLGIWPILVAIWKWERTWVPGYVFATPALRHAVCGKEFIPHFCCRACGDQVTAHEISAEFGPAGGWARSVPEARTRRRSQSRRQVENSYFADTLTIWGNRWASSVVGATFMGIARFTDFRDLLGAPPGLLMQRLVVLCERGIMERVETPEHPARPEYRLTAKGLDFFSVIHLTLQWAEEWYIDPLGAVLSTQHTTCGEPFVGELVCDQCHDPLEHADLILQSREKKFAPIGAEHQIGQPW